MHKLKVTLLKYHHFNQQVWNHPWVLKLDEDRQLEKAERLAMYGESDTEDDDSLDGFIVNESDETNSTSSSVRKVRVIVTFV